MCGILPSIIQRALPSKDHFDVLRILEMSNEQNSSKRTQRVVSGFRILLWGGLPVGVPELLEPAFVFEKPFNDAYSAILH
jgi:hypothetical protein